MMKRIMEILSGSLGSFTLRHEKFIFTTLARILAVGCMVIAALFAWKLYGQLSM